MTLLFRFLLGVTLLSTGRVFAAESVRQTIVRAILATQPAKRIEIVRSLAGEGDPAIRVLLNAWKEDALFVATDAAGDKVPVLLADDKDQAGLQSASRVDTGGPWLDAAGRRARLNASSLVAVEHTSSLRRAMKSVIDVMDLGDSDPAKRIRAVQTFGYAQNADKLPALLARSDRESDPSVRLALREAIALIRLKHGTDAEKLDALGELKSLHTIGSADALAAAARAATETGQPALLAAARSARNAVVEHIRTVNFFGTLFRGLSLGSILLVVALGLAITFGLMGVINMAHGEMIAVGAYTTYVVQNIFGSGLALSPFGWSIAIPGFNAKGIWYESYFLFALPLSFLAAAGAGILLERGVIRFLYRRPLESLLATWGVSLVLQQLFRRVFG